MMRPVSDLDVAAAVRVAARAEVIADEAEYDYAMADSGYPSSPYPAAFAALLRHLIKAGNAAALQVAVDEFDYRVAQSQEEQDRQHRRWESEHAEKTRRHEIAVRVTCPLCGAAPGDVCRTTGSTGPMAKGLDDHKARYRAATSEPSAERGNGTA
jgi:hypothetical protein